MNAMTNGDVSDLVKRSEKAALLLGHITGKLHSAIEKCPPGEVRGELQDLFHKTISTVEEIYYKDE